MTPFFNATVLFYAAVSLAAPAHHPTDWPAPTVLPELPEIFVDLEYLAGQPSPLGIAALDVRDSAAYLEGHLPGALPGLKVEEIGSPPDLQRTRTALAARGLSGAETVVLYGDKNSLARLGWHYTLLRWAGCNEVRILREGWTAWLAAGGRPTVDGGRAKPVRFLVAPRESVFVSPRQLFEPDLEGLTILDVRDTADLLGQEAPPWFSSAHVPGALPLNLSKLVSTGEHLPEPEALREGLARVGPRPGDFVPLSSKFVLYGHDDHDPRSFVAFLLLSAAGVHTQILTGGLERWQRVEALPVVKVLSASEVAALLTRMGTGGQEPVGRANLAVFDLREEADFRLGHLASAANLPFRLFPSRFEEEVARRLPGTPYSSITVVFYCYGIECVRSREACVAAAHLGFKEILWFRGGIREWDGAGLPLQADTRPAAESDR